MNLGQVWIPAATLVICGEDHAYDAQLYDQCPACGQADRVRVSEAFRRNKENTDLVNRKLAGILLMLDPKKYERLKDMAYQPPEEVAKKVLLLDDHSAIQKSE